MYLGGAALEECRGRRGMRNLSCVPGNPLLRHPRGRRGAPQFESFYTVPNNQSIHILVDGEALHRPETLLSSNSLYLQKGDTILLYTQPLHMYKLFNDKELIKGWVDLIVNLVYNSRQTFF